MTSGGAILPVGYGGPHVETRTARYLPGDGWVADRMRRDPVPSMEVRF